MPVCPTCDKDNPSGFAFCGYCRGSLATASDQTQERKLVTILFADLVGSTELGSRLDPERLRSLLERYFAAMAEVIESWGGTVEKYIGDAILAAFGVPAIHEDDAERAIRAAIEMLERLTDLNDDLADRYGETLQVRIGVNTGDVMAAVGGQLEQQIVAGDAVNVAARLEQAAGSGTILVGERTRSITRGAFRFEGPIQLDLKGKKGQTQAYEVTGIDLDGGGPGGGRGLIAGLVGRERQLGSLQRSLDEAIDAGQPRTVFVTGPAGIGKSRLLHEFVEKATVARPELSVYRGRCLAAGHGVTYWALGEILRSVFGISLDDSAQIATDKLREGAAAILSASGLSDPEVRSTTFALATTAGIEMDDNPLHRMEPEEVGEQLARAWPRFVTAVAARGATLLICEDLHWADGQLIEMLERVAVRSIGPLLLVATTRPGSAGANADFGSEGSTMRVQLAPLSDADSEELVDRLLSYAELPSALRAEILARADGNPLFVEEILGRLIDEGDLVREGSRWTVVADSMPTPLPDTIHAVIAARIDALEPGEKRTLQEASVLGRTFWEEPVALAIGSGVSESLRGLERKGLIQPVSKSTIANQIEFQFKHALVRDVAYQSLPTARRARSHAEQAAWIEMLAGERSDEFVELIAHHYVAALAPEADLAWFDDPKERDAIERKAFDVLLTAGELARRRYTVARAVEFHERAAVLGRSVEMRAAVLEALGDDHDAVLHGDAALASYRTAISVLRDEPAGDEVRGRVCMKAARMILEKSGAFSTSPEPALIDELVDEGRSCASEREVLAWLSALWGAAAVWWVAAGGELSSLDARIGSLGRAIADAENGPFPELEAFAQEYLCEVHMLQGTFNEVAGLSRRVEVFDRIGSPTARSLGFVETGIWAMDVAGEADRALDLGMRAYRSAKELSPHDLMHATGFVIAALFWMGRWQDLIPILDEHVAAFALESDTKCELLHGGILVGASLFEHLGDHDAARDLVGMAAPFSASDPLWGGYADGWRARFQILAGDPLAGLQRAEAVFGSAHPWPRFHAATVIMEALIALDDRDALIEFLPTARDLREGLAILPPTCDRAEGHLAAADGDTPKALRLLGLALEGFERLGVPFEAARAREALAAVSTPDDAAMLLRLSLDTYERLGAGSRALHVRAMLDETIVDT